MNKLKKWLVENGYTVADDATPEQIDAIAVKAISDSKLTLKKYAELSADKSGADDDDPAAAARKTLVKEVTAGVTAGVTEALTKSNTALAESMTSGFKSLAEALGTKGAGSDGASAAGDGGAGDDADDDADDALGIGDDDALSALEKRMEERFAKKYGLTDGRVAPASTMGNVLKMASDLSDEKSADTIRVKKTIERFTHKRTQALYKDAVRGGQPIEYEGRSLDEASELDKAACCAWAKYQIVPNHLTQHDVDLCCHLIETERFYCEASTTPVRLNREQKDLMKHAVINRVKVPLITDSTSGGVHAVPEVYDTQAVIIPLLQREVSPLVTMTDVAKGRQLEQWVLSNPTVGALEEGSAGTVFDATSLIADQAIPFFTVGGLFEVGKQFLEDAVPSMWNDLQAAYLRSYGKWLDDQIVGGDGTTEPLGILVASGVTDVPASSAYSVQLADLTNLMAAVGKEWLEQYSNDRIRFGMNNSVYFAFRTLTTGLSGDNRLLFGETPRDYMLLAEKVAINGMASTVMFFGQLGGYQLVRRQGIVFNSTDQGESLFTKNTILIRSDARFGGRPKQGNYFAKIDDVPS